MLVYCDASALVKLVIREAESDELDRWLAGHRGAILASSTLARAEVVRAVRRSDPDAVDDARNLLEELSSVDLTSDLADAAADLKPSPLRSLDAIHLVTALRLGSSLGAFITYDKRMIDAARTAGLTVHHPGMTANDSGT